MTDTINNDVCEVAPAIGTWAALETSLKRGYVPTIYPESGAHRRLRRAVLRAGYRVFPTAQVKLTGLTSTQSWRIDDYLSLCESCADRRVVRNAKLARVTRTTATLSHELAADLVAWLGNAKDDAVEAAGLGNATTEEEIAFAERSVARSFDALSKKIQRALRYAI